MQNRGSKILCTHSVQSNTASNPTLVCRCTLLQAQLLIDGRMACMVVHTDTDPLEGASLMTSSFYEPAIVEVCDLTIKNIGKWCDK